MHIFKIGVLIAIVLAVGTMIINGMMSSTKKSSACSSCGGTWYNGKCQKSRTDATTVNYTGCMSDINSKINAENVGKSQ